MTKRAELKQVSPSCVIVSGFDTRSLVIEVAGRAPVYNATERGWVMQPHRVPDLVALAEQRGYEVLLSAELRNALQPPTVVDSSNALDSSAVHGGGLLTGIESGQRVGQSTGHRRDQSDEVLPW